MKDLSDLSKRLISRILIQEAKRAKAELEALPETPATDLRFVALAYYVQDIEEALAELGAT